MSELPENEQGPGPPPLVRSAPPLEDVTAELDRLEAQAWDRFVAGNLAQTIAAAFDLGVFDVWAAMGELPDESLELLRSPAGHGHIGNFVSMRLTGEVPAVPLIPTIH